MVTKVTKLSKISNSIFIISSVFCLFFLWCNFYIKSIRLSFICSVIAVLAFSIIFFPIITIKNKKMLLNKNNKQNIENFKNYLIYQKNTETLLFLVKLLDIKNYSIITQNHIVANNDTDIYINFNDEVDNQYFINMIQNRNTNNIKFICINSLANITHIKGINFESTNVEKLYKISTEKNIQFDSNIIIENKPKYSIKDILCVVLCKNKSKSYFLLGILLLFSSLFTPFKNYYIIFSSIFILLSIFSRFNTIFNKY